MLGEHHTKGMIIKGERKIVQFYSHIFAGIYDSVIQKIRMIF